MDLHSSLKSPVFKMDYGSESGFIVDVDRTGSYHRPCARV